MQFRSAAWITCRANPIVAHLPPPQPLRWLHTLACDGIINMERQKNKHKLTVYGSGYTTTIMHANTPTNSGTRKYALISYKAGAWYHQRRPCARGFLAVVGGCAAKLKSTHTRERMMQRGTVYVCIISTIFIEKNWKYISQKVNFLIIINVLTMLFSNIYCLHLYKYRYYLS